MYDELKSTSGQPEKSTCTSSSLKGEGHAKKIYIYHRVGRLYSRDELDVPLTQYITNA